MRLFCSIMLTPSPSAPSGLVRFRTAPNIFHVFQWLLFSYYLCFMNQQITKLLCKPNAIMLAWIAEVQPIVYTYYQYEWATSHWRAPKVCVRLQWYNDQNLEGADHPPRCHRHRTAPPLTYRHRIVDRQQMLTDHALTGVHRVWSVARLWHWWRGATRQLGRPRTCQEASASSLVQP